MSTDPSSGEGSAIVQTGLGRAPHALTRDVTQLATNDSPKRQQHDPIAHTHLQTMAVESTGSNPNLTANSAPRGFPKVATQRALSHQDEPAVSKHVPSVSRTRSSAHQS